MSRVMGREDKMEEWGDGSDGSVGSSFLVDVVVVVGVERRGERRSKVDPGT